MKTFPSSEALRRLPVGLADLAIVLGTLALLGLIARIGEGTLVSFRPPNQLPSVDLDPRNLPYYAGRSTLRMFIALFCSTVFTLAYGYIAAHNRRAERVMIPLLDILQSVPVLGFLSITVTGFIALFPGSLLGLKAASIFAIFTSQAWNMIFSFYQSLNPQLAQYKERICRLGRARRNPTVPASDRIYTAIHQNDRSSGLANEFQLTKRELEVLTLITQGKTNQQIAETLFITAGTARVHVHAIL